MFKQAHSMQNCKCMYLYILLNASHFNGLVYKAFLREVKSKKCSREEQLGGANSCQLKVT